VDIKTNMSNKSRHKKEFFELMSEIIDKESNFLTARLGAALRAVKNMSELSRQSGVHLRQISRYAKEEIEPSASTLVKLCKALEMSVEELLNEGENDINIKETDSEWVKIDVLNITASAGNGSVNDIEEVVKTIPASRERLLQLGVKPENLRYIYVRGDSMEPTISNGALILIDVSATQIKNGLLYVILIGDDLLVKRVQRSADGGVTLISDNKEVYAPEKVPPYEIDNLEIKGRVVWTERVL
jgi:phage repressor protein C with HTH and peptisase S24 domain